MEAWLTAVKFRGLQAPCKSGMPTAAIKQLTGTPLSTMREAVSTTRALECIVPVLWFVLHVPIAKRLVVRTEEYTRPIVMEEEVAKPMAIMIIA